MKNFIELTPRGGNKKVLVNLNTVYFMLDLDGYVVVRPMQDSMHVVQESWDDVKRKIAEAS